MDINQKIFKELREGLNRTNPTPLYYQLERKLEELIGNAVLRPGDGLPGDLLLSKTLCLNNRTIRKALAGLVQKGLIKRIRKAGTFVNDNIIKYSPNIGFFYFAESELLMLKIAEHIQDYLAKNSFDLKIVRFKKDYFEKENLYNEIKRKNLQGAIIVPLGTEGCRRLLLKLEENRFPYVRFGNQYFMGELNAPLVTGNDRQRIESAIEYLRQAGHRKIGLVCNHRGSAIETGYRKFYRKTKEYEERWFMSVEFSGPSEQWRKLPGSKIARGYLEINPELTAIIVEHSAVCMDFLKQAPAVNKKIPRDLSLLCLFDWEGLDMVSPPITAICLPEKIIGEKAAEILVDIIKKEPNEREKTIKQEKIIKIDYQLMERESVAELHLN